MQAVITGATGLLGANLAIELLRQGHAVRCTRRGQSRVDHLSAFPIEWVEADLGDTGALARAFAGADTVFHCAAVAVMMRRPSPAMVEANVEGTKRVLEAFRRAGARRLVHCSSTVASALTEDGRPVTEEHPWNLARFGMTDGYTVTKHQGQVLVQEARDVDAVIVNPGYMLGPYDVRPSSGKMIIDTVRGRVPGSSSGMNNFVDVRDVARGMVLAAGHGRRGENYILGNENLGYREVLTRIARVAGVRPPRLPIPHPLARLFGWAGDLAGVLSGREVLLNSVTVKWAYCPNFISSSDKARRELGYETHPLEDAIAAALEWFRRHGML